MKKIVALLCGLLVVGLLGYVTHVTTASMKAAAELDRAKTALINEVRGLDRKAQHEIVADWLTVAKDHLNEYEMGRLDELVAETHRGYELYPDPSGYGRHSYRSLAAETSKRVWKAIERKLAAANDYPITDEKIRANLESDARVRRLHALSKARHEVSMVAVTVAKLESMEQVRPIERDVFEPCKHKLVQLLKTVP